jgi:hypothetical protein
VNPGADGILAALENAMNYWANGLDQKLVSLGAAKPAAATSAAN